MNILTVIKQVPDSNAPIKVSAGGKDIDSTGIKMIIDPFDEFGVELAVQLREKGNPVGEIVSVLVGSEKAGDTLRTALAMGVDRGLHLCDRAFDPGNELLTARLIADAIRMEATTFDLILCGKHNIDLDSGAVGPALAEFMDLPHVGAVQGLELMDGGRRFVARRRIEGAEEVVEGSFPVVLTIEKGLVEPRYPSLPNLMKAKKKPLKVLTSAEVKPDESIANGMRLEELTPPPPRPDCRFIEGEPEQMARELVRLLREEAKVI